MPSGRRHYRLTLSDVIAAHGEALRFGGRDGILNQGMIESAIARPYATFGRRPLYRRIHDKAAALVEILARNHGFIDGNKRTSLICLGILLERSGYTLSAETTNKEIEELILNVANSRLVFEDLSVWLAAHIDKL